MLNLLTVTAVFICLSSVIVSINFAASRASSECS